LYLRMTLTAAVGLSAAALMNGQGGQIRASYHGGGDPGHGKCTVDVQVDGGVDVEIRGDTAFIRNLWGRPARPRRFDCTGPMPPRITNFRFDPQEGRGKQVLTHDPRDGGPMVVHIEDREGGAEGYKFDFYWEAQGPERPGGGNPYAYRDGDDYHRERDNWQDRDWRQRIFERVRMDVEHLEGAYQSEDDRRRLGHLIRELNEMQDKLAHGLYDHNEMDDVIEALNRVLHENRLSRRDGDLLSDDLNHLRDFRARHDEYGARERR
jgi:hypothetical protein